MEKENDVIDLQNERVFRELFRRFYPRTCLFAINILKDRMLSADIVQEAFLYMWQHIRFLPDEIAFKSYLYHCVKNKCLNYVRDHRTELQMVELEEGIEDECRIDRCVIENELRARILEEVERLPEIRKEIMMMRLDGNQYEEISRELHLNINTLKTYKKQTYRELRLRLKDLGECMLFIIGMLLLV